MLKSPIRQVFNPIFKRVLPPYILPIDFFKSGEQGAWYDPSSHSTLFQNYTGTTPVTAVGQAVGLILDKSKVLELGPDLITNGTFDNDSATGWTLNSWSVANNRLEKTSGDTLRASGTLTSALVVGKTYQITLDAFALTTTVNVFFRTGVGGAASAAYAVPSGTASHSFLLTATSAHTVVQFFPGSTSFAGAIDNIIVKELPGNHALQVTSLSRPTLELQSNQFHLSGGSINWTAPAGTYTVAYLADTGPTILTSQSLSGATNVMAASKIFEYVAVDRALTAAENQGLLDYFDFKARVL